MQIVTDLHLHSHFSRAVSPQMNFPMMAQMAQEKGIDLLATGDFTHPIWFQELREQLVEKEEGIYELKEKDSGQAGMTKNGCGVKFLFSVEIACIYTQGGKGRRIHVLVFAPNMEVAEKIKNTLISRGYNLSSDGRPIIGLSAKHLLELILSIDERCLLIPAHAWTPWFGVYGYMSGFDSLSACFEELAPYVYAIETGISSDPEMNWQMEELENRSIVSFSDAHSPAKMGREATLFDLEQVSYENIRQAIMRTQEDTNRISATIEFYPEEGKYHYSGHRNCHFFFDPHNEKAAKGVCSVCLKPVTDGVMRRLQEISQTPVRGVSETDDAGLVWITDPEKKHPPFVKQVPLREIIAESLGRPVTSVRVTALFDELISRGGSEIDLLMRIPLSIIAAIGGDRVAEGIQKMRSGDIVIAAGYDGQYGKVSIWPDAETTPQLGIDFTG